MSKIQIIDDIKKSINAVFWHFFLQAVILLVLGILVILYPQIIVFLFAFFFIIMGLMSFWVAAKVRVGIKKLDKFFSFFS